jgi:serine/threonine-protein kinase
VNEVETSTGPRRRFELRRKIGEGSFGEVYLAEMVSAGDFRRPVALKLLHASVAKMRDAGRRIRDEARILGRLQHRHIVEVLDLVQVGDRWAVVMAYVPGADLEQVLDTLLARGELPSVRATLEIGAAVARALAAAWSAMDEGDRPLRVVHRDIKPGNIRLTTDGDVKVLDFGVARMDLDAREAKTRRPALVGTERYMAPERLLLTGDGPEADVYALGVTMLEALLVIEVDRAPVTADDHAVWIDETRGRLERALASDPVGAELVPLVLSCLAWSPQDRPSAEPLSTTLSALASKAGGADLVAFARGVVATAALSARGEEVSAQGTLVEGSSTNSVAPVVSAPRALTPWMTVSALAAGVGVVLAAAWFVLPAQPPPQALPELPVAAGPAEPAPADVVSVEVAGVAPIVAEMAPADAAARDDASTEAARSDAAKASAAAGRTGSAEPKAVAAKGAGGRASSSAAGAGQGGPPPPTESTSVSKAGKTADGEAKDPAPAARVSRTQFSVVDVSGFTVNCGGRQFTGTASVRATDFPAGSCTIRADRGGGRYTATVSVVAPREVVCRVIAEELQCR